MHIARELAGHIDDVTVDYMGSGLLLAFTSCLLGEVSTPQHFPLKQYDKVNIQLKEPQFSCYLVYNMDDYVISPVSVADYIMLDLSPFHFYLILI